MTDNAIAVAAFGFSVLTNLTVVAVSYGKLVGKVTSEIKANRELGDERIAGVRQSIDSLVRSQEARCRQRERVVDAQVADSLGRTKESADGLWAHKQDVTTCAAIHQGQRELQASQHDDICARLDRMEKLIKNGHGGGEH